MANARPSSFSLTAPGPLRLYSMTELLRLPPPSWLVDDILPMGGLVGIYGQPGHYKSFIAIDIAMSVATGRPWHGQDVQGGHVIYVAAEGGTGIAKRAHAWLLEHNVKPGDVNIAWMTESIPVAVDSENMDTFFTRIEEYDKEPKLVIIDTLARCFDGDENLQEDMGRFIGGVDRLRREFDATVLVVHHTRLDADRERGSTAFRGAADTMVYCKSPTEGEVEIICNKQKDAQAFLTRHLSLKDIPEVDSIVFVDAVAERDGMIRKLIQDSMPEGITFKALKAQSIGSGIAPSSLKRRLVGLMKNDEIIRENGIYFINKAHFK